jgi:hypothetical protein
MILGACADPPSGQSLRVERSDSAGVRILSIGGPLSGAAPLGVTPVWTHGFEAGEFPFQRVIAGALLSDGSAVVADAGSSEIVVVSAKGGSEVLMGSGQGPGEVRGPTALRARDGEAVWVDDDGNGRLVLLSPDGVLRSVSTQGRSDVSIALRLRGVDDAGQLLMSTSSFPREFEGQWRMADLVRMDPDDLTVDSLAQYPIAERVTGTGRNPFLPVGASTVARDSWVVGWGAEPEVQLLGEDGQLELIVRWAAEERYPDEGQLDRYQAYLSEDLRRVNPGLPDSELRSLIERQLAMLEVDSGRPLPLFRDLIGDDQGRVWVESYEVGRVPTDRFSVIRLADGSVRSVTFPTPVVILDVRGRWVLAVVTNELDVAAVSVFQLDQFPAGNG